MSSLHQRVSNHCEAASRHQTCRLPIPSNAARPTTRARPGSVRVHDVAASSAIRVPARLTHMAPRKIRNVTSRHRLITVSLSAQEFNWLNEFVSVLESAGYRRARSAVVSVALAELRGSIGKAPPHEVLKLWLRRDTKRLIAAIDGNHSKSPKVSGRPRL